MSLVKLTCPIKKALHAKRERRKEARPGELLEAALDLFVEKGFTATRVEEVAARAGVSKGTLFLYFPSKEELFKAVVRQNISSHFKEWDETFDNFKGTSAEMISLCMNEWWRRVGATKASGIKKLMLSEAGNFPDLAVFYRQEVVEPGQQKDRAIAIAQEICTNAPLAIQATKASAKRYIEDGEAAAIAEFQSVIKHLSASDDAAEGVASFKEKRPPVFTGR